MKRCCTCKQQKGLEHFTRDKATKDGLKRRCKTCRSSLEHKAQYKAAYNKAYAQKHRDELREKTKAYREANKDRIKAYLAQYRTENREQLAEYRKANAERMKEYNAAYKPRKNEWYRERKRTHPEFRIEMTQRRRISRLLGSERPSYSRTVGMQSKVLRTWLEFQFEPGMTWDNYGTAWHVDHVIPVREFDLTKDSDKKVCFAWTNLQPKYAKDNLAKKSIRLYEFFNCFVSAHRFVRNRGLGRQEYQALRESLAWLRAKISGTVTSSWMTGDDVSTTRPEMDNPQPSS